MFYHKPWIYNLHLNFFLTNLSTVLHSFKPATCWLASLSASRKKKARHKQRLTKRSSIASPAYVFSWKLEALLTLDMILSVSYHLFFLFTDNWTTEAKGFLLPNQTSFCQGAYFDFIIVVTLHTWICKLHHKGCQQGEGLSLPHPGQLLFVINTQCLV